MHARPPQHFDLRPMRPQDRPAVLELASALTDFFPEDAVSLIEVSLDESPGLVGVIGEEIVGFLIFTVRDPKTAEILWMAIKEEYHGLGLGSLLLDKLEELLASEGIKKVVVATLSYTVQYKPWEKVRTFFYNRGFKSLGIQRNYYEEGVDRLILHKRIG